MFATSNKISRQKLRRLSEMHDRKAINQRAKRKNSRNYRETEKLTKETW